MFDLNLINLGSFFFTAWIVIVAALSLKAFGAELLRELDLSKRSRVGNLK
jgi:hypothetical protein